MHHLLAIFFSLLMALCHHTSFTARPVEAAELSGTVITTPAGDSATMILPDRYQLARTVTAAESGYAEAACASCRHSSSSTSDR